MTISVAWPTGVISVPQADLIDKGGGEYEHDMEQFHFDLRTLEASQEGAIYPRTHNHDIEKTLAGVVYARKVEILLPYQVQYENLQYQVKAKGANHNVSDVKVLNQVSLITENSAGLINTTSGVVETACHMNGSYDPATDMLYLDAWLDRNGQSVAAPISITIVFYDLDSSVLFTLTQADAIALQGPDARGVFRFVKTVVLLTNRSYYADVTIVDGLGTLTTRRGIGA
jgi:hypothetical protein